MFVLRNILLDFFKFFSINLCKNMFIFFGLNFVVINLERLKRFKKWFLLKDIFVWYGVKG